MKTYTFYYSTTVNSDPTLLIMDRPFLSSHDWTQIIAELLWQVTLDKSDAKVTCMRDTDMFAEIEAKVTPSRDAVDIYITALT